MRKHIINASLLVGLGLGASLAQAATITLPLGGLRSGANIGNYFDGGNDSVPTDGTGPNLGIVFSANATAQKAGTSQSSAGRFENEPAKQGEVLFFSSSGGTLNFGSGFSGLSFDYSVSGNNSNLASTPSYTSSTVDIWSGLNGTGTLVDTITLTPVSNPTACITHGDVYCNWSTATTAGGPGFTGESITFANSLAGAQTEFDGLQLTPATVPLPAAGWLLLSGLAGCFRFGRRRQVES
jgi:hypothetical protein